MLTEVDMIRIMAAKYNLVESANKENVDNESQELADEENSFETIYFEISDTKYFAINN